MSALLTVIQWAALWTLVPLAVAAGLLWWAKHRTDRGPILDPLTGLLSLRSLEFRRREIEHQSALTREPVGVVLLDIENFRKVNDGDGDSLLSEVAYRLRSGLRAYDSIYHLGGGEILILVPGADLAHARRVGNDARAIVSQVSAGPGIAVSASCGVSASVEGEPFDFTVVSACADRALHKAKKGRGLMTDESGRVEQFGALAT